MWLSRATGSMNQLRTGKQREQEREREGEWGNNSTVSMWTTLKQKRKHEEDERLTELVLSFSSGEQPRHKLLAIPRCQRHLCWTLLRYFSYIYFYVLFFTSVYFLHLLSQKTRLLNKCVKKHLHNDCS